jgi:hypothetical protein
MACTHQTNQDRTTAHTAAAAADTMNSFCSADAVCFNEAATAADVEAGDVAAAALV